MSQPEIRFYIDKLETFPVQHRVTLIADTDPRGKPMTIEEAEQVHQALGKVIAEVKAKTQ